MERWIPLLGGSVVLAALAYFTLRRKKDDTEPSSTTATTAAAPTHTAPTPVQGGRKTKRSYAAVARGNSTGHAQSAATSAATPAPQCAVCGKTGGLLRCGGCKSVYYCSREHQRAHWSAHRDACKSSPTAAPAAASFADTPESAAVRAQTLEREAEAAFQQGRAKESFDKLDAAYAAYVSAGMLQQALMLQNTVIMLLQTLGYFARAERAVGVLVQFAEEQAQGEALSMALGNLAYIAAMKGDVKACVAACKRVDELNPGSELTASRMMVLTALSTLSLATGDKTSAKVAVDAQAKAADQTGNPQQQMLAWSSLGQFHSDTRAHDKAVAMQEKCVAASEAAGDPSLVSRAYMLLGNALRDAGRIDEAVVAHEKMLAVSTAAGSDESPGATVLAAHMELGRDMIKKGEFARAEEYLRSFLDESTGSGYVVGQIEAQLYLGELLRERKEYNKAIDVYNAALALATDRDVQAWVQTAKIMHGIAKCWQGKGFIDGETETLHQLLDVLSDNGMRLFFGEVQLRLKVLLRRTATGTANRKLSVVETAKTPRTVWDVYTASK